MRHKRHGRVLGRSPSHRRALLRNLASALILTERAESEFDPNPPKVKGRIITTMAKAKEVRPLVEKCITIARKGRSAELSAAQFSTESERHTEAWKQWRSGEDYKKWVEATAPAVTARRKLFQILCNKEVVSILMNDLAERFEDRPGGYTRILRLATPRLGDAGPRAILEFVGKNDRVVQRSEKPDFGGDEESPESLAPRAEETASSASGEASDNASATEKPKSEAAE